MINTHKDVFAALAQARETQIDGSITPKLLELSERDEIVPKDLSTILDECAFCSLASDFAMKAMNIVFQSLVREEAELVTQ